MADLRVTGGSPPTLQPARQTDAARAAQRAFFQAALNEVAPTTATRPMASQAAAQVTPRITPSQSAALSSAPEPGRYLRPGSLLDIKV